MKIYETDRSSSIPANIGTLFLPNSDRSDFDSILIFASFFNRRLFPFVGCLSVLLAVFTCRLQLTELPDWSENTTLTQVIFLKKCVILPKRSICEFDCWTVAAWRCCFWWACMSTLLLVLIRASELAVVCAGEHVFGFLFLLTELCSLSASNKGICSLASALLSSD